MKNPFLSARHPDYVADSPRWGKWRQVARGGDSFVHAYLQRQPGESPRAHSDRCDLSPAISYVQMALNEIIAAFLARLPGVTRTGKNPSSTYITACNGRAGGIDGFGSSMNQFMATVILRELLTVRRTGIYIDRPQLPILASINDVQNAPPYIYNVPVENILAWTLEPGSLTPTELLLQEQAPIYAEASTFVTGYKTNYRHLRKIGRDGPVIVSIYDDKYEERYTTQLEIPNVPFVLLEVSGPAVADVASTQIALLNLDSSNVSFAIESNLTVYTEQGDLTTLLAALRRATPSTESDSGSGNGGTNAGDDDDDDVAGSEANVMTIRLGRNRGRRYLAGNDRPDFVSPDNDNLTRTISLSSQLKEDIRRVMLLAIANVTAKSITSATALVQGQVTANNGLALLGTLLEKAERGVSAIWSNFEDDDPVEIQYPVDFQILTDDERRDAIEKLTKLRDSVPSKTYQIELTLQIAQLLLGNSISVETLQRIKSEITAAPSLLSKITDVVAVVEAGIMPRAYATQSLCLPADAAALANAEHAERLRRIAQAQISNTGTARGNSDGVDTAEDEKRLSQDPDLSSSGTRATRS